MIMSLSGLSPDFTLGTPQFRSIRQPHRPVALTSAGTALGGEGPASA